MPDTAQTKHRTTMGASVMKQSEVSDSITIRTPRGDGLLKALKAIAKKDSKAKGYAVTVTALGRIALKAYVRERMGPNVKY